MTHGTTTGHLSSMGITMTTSTAAGLPWVGWLSCSGAGLGLGKRPLTLLQRAGLLLLLGLLGFLALLALMSRLGRGAADSDPNLDPLMNPHIRVGPS